jgi:hypothetical protein
MERVLNTISARAAINGWVGPLGRSHDFEYRSIGLEVKTSAANAPSNIQIANLLQLDSTGLDTLVLLHLWLQPLAGSGETLPQLIERVRDLLAQRDASVGTLFNDRLIAAGYADSQASLYATTGYVIRTAQFYHVREGFPRLLTDAIPRGVVDVHYAVAVGALAPFLLRDEEVIPLLQGSS